LGNGICEGSLKDHTSRITTLLFLVLLLGLGLIACTDQSNQKDSIVYGLTLSPSGIDPHINASAELGIPLSSVYDTLIFQDPETGEFVPGLADSWTISSDGLTYTFVLREDVVFHDGTQFDANAVKANLDYIVNPDHLSQKAVFMLGPFESAEVLSKFSVALHLKEPFAPLLDSLSQVYLGMASPKALDEWGPSEYQLNQVGTGPYRFVEYIPNDHLTLEKNPDYAWAPSVYLETEAEIDEIVFKFYGDEATRALALTTGEADIIGEIPPHDAERLGASGEFVLHAIPIPGQPTQFFFNTSREPTNDPKIREALITALDRQFIVETVFGEFSPIANGPLSQEGFAFVSGESYPSHDPESASQLLADQGWNADPTSQQLTRNGEALTLKIVAPPWGSNPAVGQLISAAWSELGIDVTLEIAPGFGPLRQVQESGEYHLIGINFFGTDPDLLRSFFSSDGFYNWSILQDNELDSLLLEAMRVTHDKAERQALYAEISELIQEQMLIIPIRDYVNLVLARSDLEGLRFSPQGWFPYLIDLRRAP
jgi:peptide/nickel transport system substrate-binding protein